jgi:cytochrome c oxidase subunit 3
MSGMDFQASRAARVEEERRQRELDLKNKRLALFLWRVFNGGVFAFFILANYLMRQAQTSWPPAGINRLDGTIPALVTLALLVSSWTARRVGIGAQNGNREDMQRNIVATLALGLAFLIGMAFVWRQVQPGGSYTAIFFTMTGFHAFHVLAGMLLFGYVFRKVQVGAYSKDSHWGVEATVVFWHFVDLMWLLYFVVLFVL